MRLVLALIAVISCLGGVPATAASLVAFRGVGTVDSVGGRLSPSGSVVLGDSLRVSLGFDAGQAVLVNSSTDYRLFALPVTQFRGALGGYDFALGSDEAFVQVARGFAFFGGDASEAAVGYTFYLNGLPSEGSPGEPFVGATGLGQRIELTAVYRDIGNPDALTVAGLLDAGTPAFQTFQYIAGLGGRDTGVVAGSYVGSVTSSAVPEPTTWALMIVGFAVTGAAVRRRTSAQALVN